MRSLLAMVCLGSAAACATTPPVGTIEVVAPSDTGPAIEPSTPERLPFGHDDAALSACLEGARSAAPGESGEDVAAAGVAGGSDAGQPREPATCGPTALPACVDPCRDYALEQCAVLATGLLEAAPDCGRRIGLAACEEGGLGACIVVAEHDLAQGVDEEAAIERLARACAGGRSEACRIAGDAGAGWLDPAKSTALLERACELGDGRGCTLAATRYLEGEGVDVDYAQAATLLTRACERADPEGCVQLAVAFMVGRGVAKDEARGKEILRHLCFSDQGDGSSCHILGQLVGQGSTLSSMPNEALAAFERGCEKGESQSCQQVAANLYSNAKYAEAITLAGKAIADEPDAWLPRYTRGLSLFNSGEHSRAIADLEVLCPLRPDMAHCQLWLFAAKKRAGVDGVDALRSARDDYAADTWPTPILSLYLGELSEAQLLAAARHPNKQTENEQLCEAYYYLGQRYLWLGNPARAKGYFDKTVGFGITNFIEHQAAEAELARLAK